MTDPTFGRPATLADVARLAGVSAMTVSRVLREPGKVKDDTRHVVHEAMAQLRYRPNPLARGLARGRSQCIGVVMFDTAQYGPASALLGVERAARARGYGVSIVAIERPDRDAVREAVDSLDDRRVDGLVVIAPFVRTSGALLGLVRRTPIVVAEAGHEGEAPIVAIDQREGARLATEHLLDFGHRTVHHVAGPAEWIESHVRSDGWRKALATREAAVYAPIRGDWSAQSGYEAGRQLADDPEVTAVFVANDQMALGLLHALHTCGVRVPQDVSVVGFDDTPESAYFLPALTTVRQDFDRLGVSAVELLDALMNGEVGSASGTHLIAPTLVSRASTAPAPEQRGR